jgi:hypothetical protein
MAAQGHRDEQSVQQWAWWRERAEKYLHRQHRQHHHQQQHTHHSSTLHSQRPSTAQCDEEKMMFSARLFLIFHTRKDLLSTHVRSTVCACACMRSVCVHTQTVMGSWPAQCVCAHTDCHGLMASAVCVCTHRLSWAHAWPAQNAILIHIMQHACHNTRPMQRACIIVNGQVATCLTVNGQVATCLIVNGHVPLVRTSVEWCMHGPHQNALLVRACCVYHATTHS